MKSISASPLLIKIEGLIKVERDEVRRACLRAERAGHIARHGHFHAANTELNELQREFAGRPDVRISAWILIAKAWLSHAEDKPILARGHLLRAYALSCAASISETRAISSAWLAQFAYLRDDFSDMADFLRACRSCMLSGDSAAQSRFCLVVALGYDFGGQFSTARPWYIKAREHAIAQHDEPTLSAINYNIAARRSVAALTASIFGLDVDGEASLARTGLETSRSFDDLLCITSFPEWAPLVQATVLSSRKEFQGAIHLYEENLRKGTAGGLAEHRASFLADLAWCRVNVGDLGRARSDAQESVGLISEDMYVEDRMTACGRLGQYYFYVGDESAGAEFTDDAIRCSKALLSLQKHVVHLLGGVL